MSTQIYTSYNSDIGLSAQVEIRDGKTNSVLYAFSNIGVVEVEPGCYTFFGTVRDNDDGVYKAFWRDSVGARSYMELIGGRRTIEEVSVPNSGAGGVTTAFGPPGTVVIEQ